jgi:PPM family protein phosphatase
VTREVNPSREAVHKYRSCRLSDTGLAKRNNGDFAAFIEPVKLSMLEQSGCLYVVADGTGSTKQGERTSQYAVERVLTEYYQMPDISPGERLRRVIHRVNDEVIGLAAENAANPMRSALLAAVIHNHHLAVCSVGSSRAFLIREGRAQQINQILDPMEENLDANSEQMRSRIEDSSEAQGLGSLHPVTVDAYENIPLFAGDVLLLCTDGLTRYISDEQLPVFVSTGTPEVICRRLVDFANVAGGEDNTTVLVVKIDIATLAGVNYLPAPVEDGLEQNEDPPALMLGLPSTDISVPIPAHERGEERPVFSVSREVLALAAAVGVMTVICMVLALLVVLR